MLKRRTDLALEAAQLWQESAGEAVFLMFRIGFHA